MDPHFEIYPQQGIQGVGVDATEGPTGQYGWRFVAANGAVIATGNEGFDNEDNANRAIHEFVQHILGAQPHPPILAAAS